MPPTVSSARAAIASATVGLVLVAAAIAVPRWTDEDVRVHWPPLHADWDPRLGLLTLPAIAIGLLLWVALPRLAVTASWRALLAYAFAGTWLWTMALAMTEGTDGLARVFERPGEYVYDAQRVDSIGTMLRTFIDHIPMDSPDHWHTHVAGHPPGALLFFVLLDRLGITDPFWIGVVVVTIGSTAVVAVLVTLKTLGSARTGATGHAVDRPRTDRGVDGGQRRRAVHRRRRVGPRAARDRRQPPPPGSRHRGRRCCSARASTSRTVWCSSGSSPSRS